MCVVVIERSLKILYSKVTEEGVPRSQYGNAEFTCIHGDHFFGKPGNVGILQLSGNC